MSKLFELNNDGEVICSDELISYKEAKEHVEKLQDKKAMYDTWKLDIFINDTAFAIGVFKIYPSAAYKQGIFEWSIDAIKTYHKGTPSLEHIGHVHLASFPTPEAAFKSIELIQAYIQYRYNLKLEIDRKIRYDE